MSKRSKTPACLTICLESSKAFRYWESYLVSRGFKVEVRNGWLVRVCTPAEYDEYLTQVEIPEAAA